MPVPCTRCTRLKKNCIKSEKDSSRCLDCVKAGGGVRCVEAQLSEDIRFDKLIESRNQLEEEEESLSEQAELILARLSRVRKQKRLMHKQAASYLQRELERHKEETGSSVLLPSPSPPPKLPELSDSFLDQFLIENPLEPVSNS
ncbi:hypothetical protein FQN57_004251 [Myotisia sp. PD_48]|nr:hypothetical protein FQN57_004251 [Myotisia sp. PD_48]